MAEGTINLPEGFVLEEEPVSVPEGFVLEDAPSTQEQEGSILEKLYGASMRGWMGLGEAALERPKRIVSQIKMLNVSMAAEDVLKEKDPVKRQTLISAMADLEGFYDNLAGELGKAGKIHRRGQATILKNHPEWESEPPKSFVDLLSRPDKLAVTLAESMPILLSAGILTAAGQPQIGVAMMYTVEGQEAYDQAIADGASEEDAVVADVIYGTVSAALEQMQLAGIMKIGRGMFRQLANRTAQKVTRKGLKALTMDVIKVAGKEALEEMSQGTWGEVTAKIVYDKSVPEGVAGFMDRRAQEGLIGAAMGIIPGAGGAAAGAMQAKVQAKLSKEKVTQPSTDEIISSIAEIHNREGGSTISLITGQSITEGYAVAIKESVEEVIPFEQITDEQLKAYKEKHKAILAEDPKRTIGTWVSDGKTYLDISTVVPTQAEAEKIGRATNQKAIFDLGAKQDIAIVGEFAGLSREALETIQSVKDGIEKGTFTEQEGQALLDQFRKLAKEKKEALITPVVEGKTLVDIQKKLDRAYRENDAVAFNRILEEELAPLPPEKAKNILQGHAEVLQMEMKKRKVKPKKITKKRAYAMGHQIPETLGWDEEQRRDFMEQTVGVRTMKGMSLEKARTFAMALDEKLEEAGLKYEPPVIPANELVETLERTKKVTAEDPIKALNRRGIYKLRHALKSGVMSFTYGLERIERFIEGLDGHKEGAHYEHIWRPMKEADETSIENTNREVAEFISYLESQGIDTAIWLGKLDLMPGTKIELTASQRVGIHLLSQNKNGMRYLTKGMNLSLKEINAAKKFMGEDEIRIANWLSEQYEAQWPIIQQAAAQAGIDPVTLKKEYRYSPLVRTDVELEEQTDFLSELAEQFRQESFSPEKGMLEKRKEKAVGRIELDAFVIYMHNIARVQRFIAMAPVANKVGKILNNRKFKQALNDRTFNQGNKLLNSWMKDAVRGTSSSNTTSLGRAIAILRRNGILYAIGYNLPSSLRQTLSMSNAMAVDPLMLKYNPGNIAKAMTPWGYKKIESFVFDRSKLVETRSYDRDLRQKWNRQALKKKLRRKAPWSKKVMRWIRWMDKHTTVTAWKSLYDVGMEKFDGNETQAINYADKWISRTQPMANAKDLPQYFRGGQLEKLLTTFQNQINNNGNFYMYDILGAKKAGQISWSMVGYRTMFSYVLPAIMFGMIGRAGPPRTLKNVIVDLLTYPIAPVVVIGRWIDRIVRGWGQTETVAEIGPEAFVKFGRAALERDVKKAIKYALQTIGGFTGRIPAQAIRTTEGMMDLVSGETKDPRRLIYSKWAIKQGKPKKKKGIYRRTR